MSWVFSVSGRQSGSSGIWPTTFSIFFKPGDNGATGLSGERVWTKFQVLFIGFF